MLYCQGERERFICCYWIDKKKEGGSLVMVAVDFMPIDFTAAEVEVAMTMYGEYVLCGVEWLRFSSIPLLNFLYALT